MEGCTGVWVADEKSEVRSEKSEGWKRGREKVVCSNVGLAKICAIGVKLRRWTTTAWAAG